MRSGREERMVLCWERPHSHRGAGGMNRREIQMTGFTPKREGMETEG